jgi:RimJ/RimL family protein N-acetyltransferase
MSTHSSPPTSSGLPLTATLRNGQQVTVREISPDDKDELVAAFGRLSMDSRYTRFFSPMRQIPEQMLNAMSDPSPERELALVAVSAEGEGHTIIGGARYVLTPGADSCEFAVTVADDRQGLGLARLLMQTLIDHAKARGLRRMEGFVLSTNSGMRGLARRLGFTDASCPDDATLRVVTLGLE